MNKKNHQIDLSKRNKCQICALISYSENENLNNLVRRGLFINRADFARTAIRELLEKFQRSN